MTREQRDLIRQRIDARVRMLADDSGIRLCLQCFAEFEPSQPTQRFCSSRHQRNYNSYRSRKRRTEGVAA